MPTWLMLLLQFAAHLPNIVNDIATGEHKISNDPTVASKVADGLNTAVTTLNDVFGAPVHPPANPAPHVETPPPHTAAAQPASKTDTSPANLTS